MYKGFEKTYYESELYLEIKKSYKKKLISLYDKVDFSPYHQTK